MWQDSSIKESFYKRRKLRSSAKRYYLSFKNRITKNEFIIQNFFQQKRNLMLLRERYQQDTFKLLAHIFSHC